MNEPNKYENKYNLLFKKKAKLKFSLLYIYLNNEVYLTNIFRKICARQTYIRHNFEV